MWWRDLFVSISLANLIYLRPWTQVLTFDRNTDYWLALPPTPPHFIALMLNVLLLSLVFWIVLIQIRRRGGILLKLLPFALLVPLVILLNATRTLIGDPGKSVVLGFISHRTALVGICAACLLVGGFLVGGKRVYQFSYGVLLLLSPLAALSFGQAVYHCATFDPSLTANHQLAPTLPAKPAGAPRFLWIIFDEWDQNLTFTERPNGLALPEIDRLCRESVCASQVETPAMMTDISMPALITGRELASVHPKGPSELMLQPPGRGPSIPWSKQPNVFDQARALGFNTAVVAWAIPYCRVISRSLSGCWWWPGSNQYNADGTTVPQIFWHLPRGLFETIYRSPFGQSLATIRHEGTYDKVLAQSLEVAAAGQFGLTLLHMPIPHPPYFYEASTGRYTRGSAPIRGLLKQTQKGYIDALALVDRTIGELRTAMERRNVWDSTTILFTADHPFRHRPALDGEPVGHLVPYVLKCAGEKEGIHYDGRFSSLLTRNLIVSTLNGRISDARSAVSWLDENGPGSLAQ
ncbi:MAG TPA: sulfatase-like hydrolase/transferase [Bryobacteraceae bacterium]|nr:sulfatase-like hydrolase/transferase [Bryobacteraceae bacterium]